MAAVTNKSESWDSNTQGFSHYAGVQRLGAGQVVICKNLIVHKRNTFKCMCFKLQKEDTKMGRGKGVHCSRIKQNMSPQD